MGGKMGKKGRWRACLRENFSKLTLQGDLCLQSQEIRRALS